MSYVAAEKIERVQILSYSAAISYTLFVTEAISNTSSVA